MRNKFQSKSTSSALYRRCFIAKSHVVIIIWIIELLMSCYLDVKILNEIFLY